MIKTFNEITKKDIAVAGGKAANLGELTRAGFPVPPGFVVTTKAYERFVDMHELTDDIQKRLSKIDIENHEDLTKVTAEVKKLITDQEIFDELKIEIAEALKSHKGSLFAVRSSATAEDLITASFAGQQDSYLNVKKEGIIEAVRNCWASLFNPRAVYYRNEKKIPHDVAMAVVVQEMVDADFAGVMFTVDPIQKKNILIEAAHGLGEQVVSGTVTPSNYLLDPKTLEIVQQQTPYDIDVNIIKKIGEYGKRIENHYKIPQDIEFAVKDGKIFILQSRAITTL